MIYPAYNNVGYKTVLVGQTNIVNLEEVEVLEKKECYQSVYRFDSKISTYSTLSDIQDDVDFYADYLYFDIDHADLTESLNMAITLCEFLDFRDIHYEKWFSGSKGFHIQVPTVQFEFKPTKDQNILKRMAMAIAESCKVSIDSSIYNTTRIFRVGNSINNKSGLYKIPVTEWHLDSIMALAAEPQPDPYPEPWDYSLNTTLHNVYQKAKEEPKINRTVMPTEDVKNTRLFAPATGGNRNNKLYRLARQLAKRGIGEQDALFACEAWNNQLEKPLDERELKKTVISAFTKG